MSDERRDSLALCSPRVKSRAFLFSRPRDFGESSETCLRRDIVHGGIDIRSDKEYPTLAISSTFIKN